MSVIYDVATKTARITATRDECADGTLEIRTAADAVLATFGLSASGGTVATDTWTLVFDASPVVASGTGLATKAVIKDSVAGERITGLTVGTSGTDIILDNNNITSGQNVDLTSATIQHA